MSDRLTRLLRKRGFTGPHWVYAQGGLSGALYPCDRSEEGAFRIYAEDPKAVRQQESEDVSKEVCGFCGSTSFDNPEEALRWLKEADTESEGVVVEITELNEEGTFFGRVKGNALYLTPLGIYRLTRIPNCEDK